MKALILSIVVITATVSGQMFSQHDVRSFGVVGDGATVNTSAIQRAIDSCSVIGGTLHFPAGNYVTGSLTLKSNVDIYLAAGATILGSTDLKDYEEHIPALRSYNDVFLRYSLFYAEGAGNISIRGEGKIDGQGAAFKVTTKEKPARYKNRPYIIRFVQCSNVRIEGITMMNSAMWMQQYLACENLRIHGIRVYNHANKNNDMMDIDGCRNVVISDCIGDTDDDGITLKSTSPFITENVTITNCVLSSHCNALKTGTESTGGFRNIAISNIVVKPSQADTVITGHAGGISGFILASVDGGILEGVVVSNIRIDGPQVPFSVRLGNRARKHTESAPPPPVSIVRDITIRGVSAQNVGNIGCSVTGIPDHPVERVSISDVQITFAGGGSFEDAAKKLPELEDAYPEGTMWGTLPAYGFFIRHANDVSLTNVSLFYQGQEQRPALMTDDVADLDVSGFKAAIDPAAAAFIVAQDVRRGVVSSSIPRGATNVFVRALGGRTSSIVLTNNILREVRNAVVSDPHVNVITQGNIQ